MRNSRLLLTAFAFSGVVGLCAPAAADPFTSVSLTYTTTGYGEGATIAPYGAIDYIGPFSVTVTGGLDATFIAFCDDFNNDINPDGTYSFFVSNTEADAEAYQSGLSATAIHEIIGLTFHGVTDYGSYSAADGAAIQLAIWQLQNGVTATAPSGLDAAAQALISGGSADTWYSDFLSANYMAVQLEAPESDCTPAAVVGSMTYNTLCQWQGLLTVAPNGHTRNVPEPASIAFLGTGLIGGAFVRRRRTSKRA
jgi:hypothetical protein